MLRSALAELRTHPGRFAAVVLAVVLGVGFAAATQVFTAGFNASLIRAAAADVSRIDVQVQSTDGQALDADRLARIPGVLRAEPAIRTYVDFAGSSSRGYLRLTNIPADPAQRWYGLDAGRWPTGTSELAIDHGTATRNHWQLGSTITLGAGRVTVVGVLDTKVSPMADSNDGGYAPLALLTALPGVTIETVNLVTSADPATVAAKVEAEVSGVTAQTSAEIAQQAVEHLAGGTTVLTIILLAFVVLAGLVAAMVVANTFTILITGRQRQIALLRCVGATGAQVRRSALTEVVLVAVIGSVLGVGVGIGIGRLAGAIAGISSADQRTPLAGLTLTALIGVLVTVVAALAPTARAARIAPMAALRPVDTVEHSRRVGRVRLSVGLLFLLGGGAVLGAGAFGHQLLVAIPGGALTAIGVLVLIRVTLPAVLRLVGGVGGLFGPTGRLAVANIRRNPSRAAATCTALVVGVGAVVTLLVATASAQAGADRAVGLRNPLDLQITAQDGKVVPAGLLTTIAAIDGVRAAVAVDSGTVTLNGSGYRLFGPSAAQLSAVRNGGQLEAGQIALPGDLIQQLHLEAGALITLKAGTRSVTLAVSRWPITDDGSLVVLRSDLLALDPSPQPTAIWAKFTAGAAPNAVIAAVNPVVAPLAGLDISGAGVQRAATAEVLDAVIKVALALLAVAVVIAVVGIGNTLGLSVVERTRESALLRALGLRRRQLRSMLAVEAGLLALLAAAVGIVFGTLFGFAAVGAAFGEAGATAVLSVPWLELVAVTGGALLAGVLASILPGRRAARATPIQALVDV
ncbi:putative ABC transport system permease protein [Nakamurella panacisegetis]|uniref:Putative ABC transport system permease protein n=1 Tax=Nakamurella panacisegetis TaxID=1090615 RepID=A0A1H0LXW6_9ACTN|nr:ABC transporter permease [Nakamurella panacisegetis]SDO72891.1 putative ABC transport system permease protein [Nakamurella panacisegetis]